MIHHNAPRMGRPTAALIFALVAGSACSVERTDELPRSEPDGSALTTPTEIGSASQCRSHINDSGLLCSRCPGDAPGAAPECLAATCQVDHRRLVCTDPKGRVGVDSSVDYSKFVVDNYSASPNGTFNFATCTFLFGIPKSSGTTCFYPGANTCESSEADGSHCLTCSYPNGGSLQICGADDNPLYDPLIERPDDLPAPGFCTNDLSADGQVECTTCMHDDLSATRSCHYPGIVECSISDLGTTTDEDGCVGRCTYEDGHQARMCESPRGVHPVPLP
jgi:hypothetical protein